MFEGIKRLAEVNFYNYKGGVVHDTYLGNLAQGMYSILCLIALPPTDSVASVEEEGSYYH